MANYPTSVPSFAAVNDGDVIADEMFELAYDEIAAIGSGLVNGLEHPIRLADATEYTIASGVITVAKGYARIDTEANAATDDLDTITAGTNVGAGSILVCRAENTARVVTLKDGTGNLHLNGDYAMSATDRTITLIYDGTNWREIARSVPSSVTRLSKSAAYTVAAGDGDDVLVFVDASGGAVTITLPTAVGNNQRVTVVKTDSSANAVTIDPNGAETIGGETTLLLYKQRDFLTIFSDNSNWQVIAEKVTIYARAYRGTSDQTSVTTGTLTKVQFNAETEDTAAAFDSATNYRFTAPRAGRYAVRSAVQVDGANGTRTIVAIYVNGAIVARASATNANGAGPGIADEVRVTNGQTIEIYALHDRGSDSAFDFGSELTWVTITYVGN